VASNKIDEAQCLLRYVAPARLRRDEDNNVVGVLPEAFALRPAKGNQPAEKYLSATWVGYFAGIRNDQIAQAVRAVRASNLKVKTTSGFAAGTVKDITGGCESMNIKIRVLHEPEDDNKAHSAVRGWPMENEELLALMANELWSEVVLNADVPP